MKFWFQALDYIMGKNIERYRISISKEIWLPVRIERYTLENELLELTLIKNYHTINTPFCEDKSFCIPEATSGISSNPPRSIPIEEREETLMITAEQIISLLQLKPHPEEGGYFVETYRYRRRSRNRSP